MNLSRVADMDILGEFTRLGQRNKIDLNKVRIYFADSFSQASPSLLYAATPQSCTLSDIAPQVELLIINEAAQVPVDFLDPLQHQGKRIICQGDSKRLPPVLKSHHNTTITTTEVFSCFIGQKTRMLDVQYRMNAAIQEAPSRLCSA